MITDESTADETGDEPLMIYHRTNALVCVGSDRIKSANKLIEQGCDVIIADDGLQHYRLQRDIEFLVVDGKRRFGNGLLFTKLLTVVTVYCWRNYYSISSLIKMNR